MTQDELHRFLKKHGFVVSSIKEYAGDFGVELEHEEDIPQAQRLMNSVIEARKVIFTSKPVVKKTFWQKVKENTIGKLTARS